MEDCEKESDSEDSKEAKEKLFTSDHKGFNGNNKEDQTLHNKYSRSGNIFISSDHSRVIYSPPWIV